MKSKSGYGMKKRDTKVAGGPSFLIGPVDDESNLSPEEKAADLKKLNNALKTTPRGQEIIKNARKLRATLRGV
jgi:hypothetical protein